MRFRWRWILPAFGLILFLGETVASVRLNREFAHGRVHRRYFWWGTFKLDSEPRLAPSLPDCRNDSEPCSNWVIEDVRVEPGYFLMVQLVATFPAFVIGVRVVHGFGKAGISEVHSFFALLPFVIFGWYYLLGWLVDKWRSKWLLETAHGTS